MLSQLFIADSLPHTGALEPHFSVWSTEQGHPHYQWTFLKGRISVPFSDLMSCNPKEKKIPVIPIHNAFEKHWTSIYHNCGYMLCALKSFPNRCMYILVQILWFLHYIFPKLSTFNSIMTWAYIAFGFKNK